MKIILTESQLELLLEADKLTFLKNRDVIDPKVLRDALRPERHSRGEEGAEDTKKKVTVTPIQDDSGIDIAYIIEKKGKRKVNLSEVGVETIYNADPSKKKEYAQWLLDSFKKVAVKSELEAQRFYGEDLGVATEALEMFNVLKNRRIFNQQAKELENAPSNPKDIRQYDSIGQLFSIVTKFSLDDEDEDEEGGEGKLSSKGKKLYDEIQTFVNLEQAEIKYRDDKVIVYSPQTLKSSCEPLGNMASWCTRTADNTYFDRYRRDNPKPDGSLSDYYVVMPLELFTATQPSGHDFYPLQFHFESDQIRDKTQSGYSNISDEEVNQVLNDFPGMAEFFRNELGDLAAQSIRSGTGLMENHYIKYLNMFGGTVTSHVPEEAYTEGIVSIKRLAKEDDGPVKNNRYVKWLKENTDEDIDIVTYISEDTTSIDFSGLKLGTLPDISKFTQCSEVVIMDCGLNEMPSASILPPNTTYLGLSKNNISSLNFEGYGEGLKDIEVIIVMDNPIKQINTENLGKIMTNGEFVRLALDQSTIQEIENYEVYYQMSNSVFEEDGAMLTTHETA
tara:strand:- start:7067 stop:8749 length:1683 start_codon:yes stop_codon:yes gene_type:complete